MKHTTMTMMTAGALASLVFAPLAEAARVPNPIPEPIPKSSIGVELEPVATGLTAPNLLTFAPGDAANRQFVVDQSGGLRVIKNGQLLATPFLDLLTTDALTPENHVVSDRPGFDERGFLGLAFHPGFNDPQSPGYKKFYTYHSAKVGAEADFTVPLPDGAAFNNQSLVYEWTVDDPNADVFSGTNRQLLRIDEPQFNHDAGMVGFGQDGNLYISLGDGGQGDDQGDGHSPQGNGQDLTNVLGTVLRIDPTNTSTGKYAIPDSNPFLDNADVPDEIFAYGLRNPFRFSFDTDPNSGAQHLIIADVGQNDIEEINRIDINTDAGANFGWHLKEGTFVFDPNGEDRGFVTDDPPPDGLVDPVAQYDHERVVDDELNVVEFEGRAIIGGFICRDCGVDELEGKYVFGDFSRGFGAPEGRLFTADLDTGVIEELTIGLDDRDLGLFVKGMGHDADGNIYLLGSTVLGPTGDTGVVLRITPVPEPASLMLWAMGGVLLRRRGRKTSS